MAPPPCRPRPSPTTTSPLLARHRCDPTVPKPARRPLEDASKLCGTRVSRVSITLMRVLFSTLTAYGHFFQVLPLAVAARRAGHEVVFATGQVRHKLLGELGLEVAAAGRETEELVHEAARAVGVPPPSEQAAPDRQAMELISKEFCRLAPKSYVDDLLPEFER